MNSKSITIILILYSLAGFFQSDPNGQLFSKPVNSLFNIKKNTDPTPTHYPANIQSPVHYTIEAQLLPEDRKVLGSETIHWSNGSEHPVDTLRFHLYFNAFQDEKSSYFRELNYFQSKKQMETFRYGQIRINEIRILEGEELTSKIRYVSPDDKNPNDKTVMEIKLRQPVPPSHSVSIKVNFTLTIPEIIHGIGQSDDYFFLGHWFPKIGVLKSDGSWNCPQFHWNSGFLSDFGKYQVTITLPEKFVIGATGQLESKTKNSDGTYSFVFMEKNIHDFAWVAYPHFREIIEKIRLRGKRDDTEIVLLLSPHHNHLENRFSESLKFALQYYADHILPYPYRKITLVDPPLRASQSVITAYPNLIAIDHLFMAPKNIKINEARVFHEFGHQYWGGIIGNDQSREAWLDAAISTFFEVELQERFSNNSPSLIDSWIVGLDITRFYRWKFLADSFSEPVNQPSWRFRDQKSFRRNVFYKAALFLKSLASLTGTERMSGFFKAYARKFKFKYSSTRDFIEFFNQYTGGNYTWAFDQFINNPHELDQSVYSVKSVPLDGHPERFRNEVIFFRNQGYFPAELFIKLRSGKEIRYFWNERQNWRKIEFTDDSPIKYAAIDPAFKIPLDRNANNNSRCLTRNNGFIKKISAKFGLYFQEFLTLLIL